MSVEEPQSVVTQPEQPDPAWANVERMDRQPTLQTVTWLLNLRRYGQLDLDPPYQRKSVWSLREKQRFLDTILRNYPSPAIFLHVTFDDDGNATYHVVDGKQRLSTILDFVDNRLRLAKDFGDTRLDGKRWRDLQGFPTVRKILWTVEQIDDVQEPVVREIFERLNRNSRKLERQEMRHARFDGWLISFLEDEAKRDVWRLLKIVTSAKSRRMSDVQTLSELADVVINREVVGFDQDALDELYADLEDPAETRPDWEPTEFESEFARIADHMAALEKQSEIVSRYATARNHFYTLWAAIALSEVGEMSLEELSSKYSTFMEAVSTLRELEKADPGRDRSADDERVIRYLTNSVGAATEHPQRVARYEALTGYLLG
jgi:hypothetical protein